MSLRFSTLAAMRVALGPRVRVRDSFGANAGPRVDPSAAPVKAGRMSRSGATPHDILWEAVSAAHAGAVREFENAVPGRKYRLDIAIPSAQLAIEVDGWEWHGKHKGDFQRDRERQNLLTLNGWRILRFTAGKIRRDVRGCLNLIECTVRQGRSGGNGD